MKQKIFSLMAFVAAMTSCAKPNNADTVVFTTKYGDVKVILYDDTPLHRDNFVRLVSDGLYDSLLFHRVINGFMIQGGDPESRNAGPETEVGSGDLNYTVPAEINYPKHLHRRGVLAAARIPDKENPQRSSSATQFYIVQGKTFTDAELDEVEARKNNTLRQMAFYKLLPHYQDSLKYYQDNNMRDDLCRLQTEVMTRASEVAEANGLFAFSDSVREIYRTVGGAPHLDNEYTVFGEVVEGLEVIDSVAAQPVGFASRPLENIVFSIKILE